jgi:hypothetical protein
VLLLIQQLLNLQLLLLQLQPRSLHLQHLLLQQQLLVCARRIPAIPAVTCHTLLL